MKKKKTRQKQKKTSDTRTLQSSPKNQSSSDTSSHNDDDCVIIEQKSGNDVIDLLCDDEDCNRVAASVKLDNNLCWQKEKTATIQKKNRAVVRKSKRGKADFESQRWKKCSQCILFRNKFKKIRKQEAQNPRIC